MLIFATIFGIGFLILILSLLFGHDHDIDADASGDLDSADHPSVFSVKVVALFMVGFGSVGFGLRTTTDWTMIASSMGGVAGAIVVAGIGYVIIRAFYASSESSTINDRDVIGQTANVIDAIDGNNYGQITCIVRGREITFLARTDDGEVIARGAPVKIVSKSGNVVSVSRI
ncbi:MAG: NfeD family protein [Candidatus Zixiibacteriota bacterium]